MCCKITVICNNAFRLPHKGPPHTAIHFLLRTKLGELKAKFINLFPWICLAKCWEPRVFSFKTLPQSILVILFIWHGGKAERIPRFEKNPKIWCSKIYLNSLWLSKRRKCSNVVNQMKIKREKSNDQIQIKYINFKRSTRYEKVV